MQKSQYEVDILVNGKPLKEYLHDGKMYVEGRKGSTFALRLRNNTGSRKLFIPSIDGLSVMDGKNASFDSSGYIVRPYSSITIDGWRKSDNEVAEFYFSSPDDSYGARTDKAQNLGVIGVVVFDEKEHRPTIVFTNPCVHHWTRWCCRCQRYHCTCEECWPKWTMSNMTYTTGATSATASSDAIMLSASNNTLTSSVNMCATREVKQDLGAGWGETKRSEVVSVDFERGSQSAIFEIYYNTREQLERIGVNFHKEPLYVAPQSFPGQYCQPPKK